MHAAIVPLLSLVLVAPAAHAEGWAKRWLEQPPSVAWNGVVAELVLKYQQNPLRAARAYTYAHVAIHEAGVACARVGCAPDLQPVAMHAAASRMLAHLYPNETFGRLEAMGHGAASAFLEKDPSQNFAWQAGRSAAGQLVRRALNDGWDLPRLPAQRPAWKPGVWRASPPLNLYDPLEPHAARWRTWVLKDGAEIEPPPPPVYGSELYWKEVEEVRAVTAALTPAQKRIAEDWNLDLGSITPAGVWNQHAAHLASQGKLESVRAARVFSALNMAMMDAFIACWHAKFRWWTERPVTVIREQRDKTFTPHVLTPVFPSYVSGHASVSGAAAAVLAAYFPEKATDLRRMADEAAQSRLYGGIHFRSDNEAGLALGRAVAELVLAREHRGR